MKNFACRNISGRNSYIESDLKNRWNASRYDVKLCLKRVNCFINEYYGMIFQPVFIIWRINWILHEFAVLLNYISRKCSLQEFHEFLTFKTRNRNARRNTHTQSWKTDSVVYARHVVAFFFLLTLPIMRFVCSAAFILCVKWSDM